jgi:hypothetical protein
MPAGGITTKPDPKCRFVYVATNARGRIISVTFIVDSSMQRALEDL